MIAIPPSARTELCQKALEAQAACLAIFDAVEDGETALSVAMHLNKAAKALAVIDRELRLHLLMAMMGVADDDRR